MGRTRLLIATAAFVGVVAVALPAAAQFGTIFGGPPRPPADVPDSGGGAVDPTLHFERRWVIYNGTAEASRIPPEWHGWMHHTVDVPPTEDNYKSREWEKPHVPNMTGTPQAYRPSGSTLASGRRPKATGDYQPWTPGS